MAAQVGWLTLVTGPADEPILLTEAKRHLLVADDDDSQDDYILDLIRVAREYGEGYQERAYITQTWDLSLEDFPSGPLDIPMPPLQSIVSVTYYGPDDVGVVVPTTVYRVDKTTQPFGRLVLKYGQQWPSVTLRTAEAVVVRFTAGYGADAKDVPEITRQALRIMIGHWFENREPIVTGTIVSRIPWSAEALLDRNRVRTFS